jgi:SSS family solute:Na+ symporter
MSATVALFSYFFHFMHDFGTDQLIVQRLMAVPTYRDMAKATILSAVIDLIVVGLLSFVGLGLLAYYRQFPEQLPAGYAGDRVLPHYIVHALPDGVSGLLITAIFAAAMSSMDSGINSLATVLVSDFVRPLRKRSRSEEHDIRLARWITCLLGAVAIGAACYAASIANVFQAALTFLGLFSGPILALFLLGIFLPRANFLAWCTSAVMAIGTTIWLQQYRDPTSGQAVHYIYYFPFCFGVSLLLAWCISLAWPGPLAPPGLSLRNAPEP